MAEASSADAGPNLNLTPEEKRVYGQLFRQADTDSVGVVTGDVAVQFFDKTRLDKRVLGEIWQIADNENRGFLTPHGFGVVLRLIGHAQAGLEPSPELALRPGPLPQFDGFTPTPPPPPPPPPVAALQSQQTGVPPPIRIPNLTPDKVAQYASLFERQPLQNGNMLPGDQAKQIFEKSGLPNETLGRIWMLADTEQRGSLVLTEFVIAMHLLTSMKSGALRGLPNILPAALYEAATRRAPLGASIPRQQSPTAAAPPISAVPRQLTGQGTLPQMRTGSPLGRPPLAAQTTGDWLVTPADKARFDILYDELDKGKKGFITGDEAVNFFSQSNLDGEVLAQIWDLADLNKDGMLSRDEFAIAMYLIRQQRSKRDGANPLPTVLPPNLIPPSLRTRPAAAPPAPAFEPPPRAQPKPSALDDLFGLDDPQPPAPAQVPVATGGSVGADPFATSVSPPPSSPARPSPSTSTFKPFVPSSSFGRGLTAQATGGSSGSASGFARPGTATATPTASFDDDLLGDTEPEVTKNLTSETTELANLSNQVGSLTKQVQDVQAQRTATQNELNQITQQKKNFEQRLSQLRAMYEKEAQDVRSLETQVTAFKTENKKLISETAMVDASLQETQTQHQQLLAALQADQQENAALKEKIRAVNAEIAQLKPRIEKLKSEARQQKGLVAINKKQLATNEAERDRLKGEADELVKSNEELARQVSSSSPVAHVSSPAQVASPALSATSANNPFFRRTGSTDIGGAFSPPPVRSFSDKAFDDVFGPVGGSGSQAGTPPPLAPAVVFKHNTGTSTNSVGSFATPVSASPSTSRQPTIVAEPSAESRQLASSFFSDSPEITRQMSPPASRSGQAEQAQDGQANTVASPSEPTLTGQSLASGSSPDVPKASSVASAPDAKPGNNSAVASAFASAFEDAGKASATADNSDPFGADHAKAKEDFESAFASFKSAQTKTSASSSVDTAKAFSAFNSEFPPISELERDDESDSESDRGGFDDDFAPASPPPKAAEKTSESKSASPVLSKSTPDVSAPAAAAPPKSPEPPTASVASPAPTASAANISSLSNSSVDDIFGSAARPTSGGSTAPTRSTATPTASKGVFDDLDDDFEGLEDAKEGSADDDFANISRSGLDDFNPVFDSSPPPSQPKGGESNASYGVESSFDFGSLSTTSAGGSTAGGVPTNVGAAAGGSSSGKVASPDSHEWDALFADLDKVPSIGSGTGSTAATGTGGGAKEPARPTTGRALTEEGEHDDPMLKSLISMGYSRKEALAALEKYDYNLERAANYLASQS